MIHWLTLAVVVLVATGLAVVLSPPTALSPAQTLVGVVLTVAVTFATVAVLDTH